MKRITVFTPTYNRVKTLPLGYHSLLRQTCQEFVWLIIDDGSTDGTHELVEEWIKENRISIRYHFQDNQGMHGAHNTAYRLMDTEFNVCMDSDDYLTDNAIERILSFWSEKGTDKYAGIIGLSRTFEGKLIGSLLPEGYLSTTLLDFYYKKKGKGDKVLVYRTEVIRKYPPYPLFEGEKYVGLSYLYHLIDRDYELLILNEPLLNKKYLLNGSSYNIYQQYWDNPKGFAFLRLAEMKFAPTFLRCLKVCIHYVSSCIRLKDKRWLSDSPRKVLTLLAAPLGVLLYIYIRHKVMNGKKYNVKY